jgi:hypothetical protein
MAYVGPRGIPLSSFLTWSPEDQEAALSWQAHEGRRHGACGTHPEDFADPRHPDVHFHPAVCTGCQRLAAAREALAGDNDGTRGLDIVASAGAPVDCAVCNPNHPSRTR